VIKSIIEAPITSDLEACTAACFSTMHGNHNLDMVTLRLTHDDGSPSVEVVLDRASVERSGAFGNFLERVQNHIRESQAS